MIDLTDVHYIYPDGSREALSGITLHAAPGSFTGIIGASGAGKTTLAKVLAGFIPHSEGGELTGSVQVDGQPLAEGTLLEAVSRVGLILQNPFNQISGARFTVRGEIAFGLENAGVPRADMIDRIAEVADRLRIKTLLERSPSALSGGQQQLVAIASMLVLRTPVLVLDEPTAQLDPAGTRLVLDVLDRSRAAGTTIVWFEHKPELVAAHVDQVHVLAGGALVASGSATEVLADERADSWGVTTTRYTRAARLTAAAGLRPADSPLPVALDQAVAYFGPQTRRP